MSLGSSGFLATVTGLTCADLQTVLVRLPYVLPMCSPPFPVIPHRTWHASLPERGVRTLSV